MAKETKRVSLKGLDIAAIVQTLNAKYGDGTVIRASRAAGAKISYISSGCYGYDFATGGGIPRNRITEIRGPYSAGKSTLAQATIAQFQQADPNGLAAFIDLEKTFDPSYSSAMGVDLDNLLLINPDSGEQAVDLINDLLDVSQDLLMVLDSLAAMTPTALQDSSADQQFMGLQARLVNRAFSVFNSRMKRGLYDAKAPTTTMLVLNQLREKIGVMFGNPETTPGGKGKDFYYSMRARVSSPASERIKEVVTNNGQKRTIVKGFVTNVTIDKNKCGGGQFNEATYEYYVKAHKHYKKFTFNNDEVLFAMALYYGIIDPVKTGHKVTGHKINLPFKKKSANNMLPANEKKAIVELSTRPVLMHRMYLAVLDAIHAEGSSASAKSAPDDDSTAEGEE